MGMVQTPRQRLISSTQYNNERKTSAKPPLKSTNELVQRFLLMGNQMFHTSPANKPQTPASSITIAFFAGDFCERSQWPVSTPSSVVAIAGMVLRIPSGVARAIEEMSHEKLSIQPRREILIGVHERNVAAGNAEARHRNKPQQRPVSEQAGSDGD